MQLVHDNWFDKTLVVDIDRGAATSPEPLVASVTAIQPQGYAQRAEVTGLALREGQVCVPLFYPLIDEGRYDPPPGVWDGGWLMGSYRFEVTVRSGQTVVQRARLELDAEQLFPRDHRYLLAVDADTQLIECAPRQALYTDEAEASFTARIRLGRVSGCLVEVDVVDREGTSRRAGPWRLDLDDAIQERRFDLAGWPDGEYWIRLRVLDGGEPAGPFCVRKLWKQAPLPAEPPPVVDLDGRWEVLVDDYVLEAAEEARFVADSMQRAEQPITDGTAAHEEEGLQAAALAWDEQEQSWRAEYVNTLVSGARKADHDRRAGLRMIASSADGLSWLRPDLGRVSFDGSTENNIAEDRGAGGGAAGDADDAELEHDLTAAQFRFYAADRDGPIDLRQVFVASGKGRFPFDCASLQDAGDREPVPGPRFAPRRGEFWPFEKRGDLYLVLTREPVLYLGIGMDLLHTTESMRCHVELDREQPRLLWYFRPGSPAYPPHGAPCDNMQMCLRCLAVMWTDDGLHYERRFVLAADRWDPVGTQLYAMGFLQRFGSSGEAPGRPVLHKLASKINQAFPERNLHLGTVLLHYGIEQTQAPELIWTRDLLNFHRFQRRRRPVVPRGPGGSFDCSMVRDHYRYAEHDGHWLYEYVGINTRHNGYGIMAGAFTGPDDVRDRRPSHRLASYFSTWEGHYADGLATRYLPAFARCDARRVAHAEPRDVAAVLVTRPLRVGASGLRVNAATGRGGSVTVTVTDAATDAALLERPVRFRGDETDALIADLDAHRGTVVRVRFELQRARLYAFVI